jgi:hypothetical protein
MPDGDMLRQDNSGMNARTCGLKNENLHVTTEDIN